jgi:hypothetical protein
MTDWLFAESPDTLVFTTQPVMDGGPIRDVHHDDDGDWQILCGTTLALDDARMVHLGHLVDMHPSLRDVADLPRGWSATACADSDHDGWCRSQAELEA